MRDLRLCTFRGRPIAADMWGIHDAMEAYHIGRMQATALIRKYRIKTWWTDGLSCQFFRAADFKSAMRRYQRTASWRKRREADLMGETAR